jgi:hypothetical protein
MNHLRLRNFLLGYAHANSAPPQFALKDIELDSPHVTTDVDLDECEEQMMNINDTHEFWYFMGRLADEGYTLKPPEDEADDLLCFKYLEQTI